MLSFLKRKAIEVWENLFKKKWLLVTFFSPKGKGFQIVEAENKEELRHFLEEAGRKGGALVSFVIPLRELTEFLSKEGVKIE